MNINECYPLDVINIRLVSEQKLYSEVSINSPQEAINVVGHELMTWDREVMAVVNCTTKGVPLNVHLCSTGTKNAAMVSASDLLKSAILSNATSVIFLHNHPSGDPSPSKNDNEVYKNLKRCYEMMGLTVIDSIVIGRNEFYSMKCNVRGMLPFVQQQRKVI